MHVGTPVLVLNYCSICVHELFLPNLPRCSKEKVASLQKVKQTNIQQCPCCAWRIQDQYLALRLMVKTMCGYRATFSDAWLDLDRSFHMSPISKLVQLHRDKHGLKNYKIRCTCMLQ